MVKQVQAKLPHRRAQHVMVPFGVMYANVDHVNDSAELWKMVFRHVEHP